MQWRWSPPLRLNFNGRLFQKYLLGVQQCSGGRSRPLGPFLPGNSGSLSKDPNYLGKLFYKSPPQNRNTENTSTPGEPRGLRDRPGPHPAKPGCQRRHHLHNILCSHCAEVTECAGKHAQHTHKHTHISNTTLSGLSLSCGISPGPRQKSSNAHHQVQLNLQHHQDSTSPQTLPDTARGSRPEEPRPLHTAHPLPAWESLT